MTAQVKLHADTGTASYYATRFHGRKTASGELFHKDSLTAAHKYLPFGTIVKVTLLGSDKFVYVRINDRGMTGLKRIIDLSPAAAQKLGLIQKGVGRVVIEYTTLREEAPDYPE
jgi:rare lipoprotein A